MELKPFLTGVADAIREKKGTADKIPASNFASEIAAIQSGGGESFNIAWGDTPPSDTTKLWVKTAEREKVTMKNEVPTFDLEVKPLSVHSLYQDAGLVEAGKKIYLFGGYDSYLSMWQQAIQVFDTETETIKVLATSLPGRNVGMGVGGGGPLIWLFGGDYGNSPLSTIQAFDRETEEIIVLDEDSPVRGKLNAATVGMKIYLFERGDGSNRIWLFDEAAGTITTLSTKLPQGGEGYGAVAAAGSKIYLFGGSFSNFRSDTIVVFDTETEIITTLSTTLPKKSHSGRAETIGDNIYLLFEDIGGQTLSPVNVFNIDTETITTLSVQPLYNGRNTPVGAVGNTIYMFHGNAASSSSKYPITKLDTAVVPLMKNEAFLGTTLQRNLFSLISSNKATIELGVQSVYAGNENNEAEQVEAYLYNADTQSWELIQ